MCLLNTWDITLKLGNKFVSILRYTQTDILVILFKDYLAFLLLIYIPYWELCQGNHVFRQVWLSYFNNKFKQNIINFIGKSKTSDFIYFKIVLLWLNICKYFYICKASHRQSNVLCFILGEKNVLKMVLNWLNDVYISFS